MNGERRERSRQLHDGAVYLFFSSPSPLIFIIYYFFFGFYYLLFLVLPKKKKRKKREKKIVKNKVFPHANDGFSSATMISFFPTSIYIRTSKAMK